MTNREFSKKILNWYLEHRRDLPWRKTRDPYRIWLSEVILQQTRVSQGMPYYYSFIKNFPNINALANASQQQVLHVWQGLGYYSRARNLHACAREVAFNHDGKFPTNYKDLIALPGIGSYTAAAISSIAFNEPVAVVDGNVYRVLSRVFGIRDDISSTKGKKTFFEKAQQLIDGGQPGSFNQAVMEFGALHCTPKNPDCGQCIFSRSCYANIISIQELLPVNEKKVKVRQRHFNYVVVGSGKHLAMRKRESSDIWKGLFDFYLIEGRKSAEQILVEIAQHLWKRIKPRDVSFAGSYKHVLTHQKITARFFTIDLNGKNADATLRKLGLKLYSRRQIESLPKPVLISRFLNENGFLE